MTQAMLVPAKAPKIDIAWRDYFEAFRERHGRFPMTYKGALLFPDGWRYAFDHRGPEYPPPDLKSDPRGYWTLIATYWRLRKVGVLEALAVVRAQVEGLTHLIGARDAPISVRVTSVDGDGRKTRTTESAGTHLERLTGRVKWLEADLGILNDSIRTCEIELRLLRLAARGFSVGEPGTPPDPRLAPERTASDLLKEYNK